MSAEIALDGGQFPELVHVNALAMGYMVEMAELTERWTRDAEQAVGEWRTAAAPGEHAREAARSEFARYADVDPSD